MRIPLHGNGTRSEILDLHMKANHINPRGFRTVPTSRKNPKTHSNRSSTRVEALAKEVYGK